MSGHPDLSSAERKRLRGQAMNLKPAVMIGRAGISETVIEATRTALRKDGLIKVRLEAPDRTSRRQWLENLASATGAAICGSVGHTASLYRPREG
jgi:RNA-binding protein